MCPWHAVQLPAAPKASAINSVWGLCVVPWCCCIIQGNLSQHPSSSSLENLHLDFKVHISEDEKCPCNQPKQPGYTGCALALPTLTEITTKRSHWLFPGYSHTCGNVLKVPTGTGSDLTVPPPASGVASCRWWPRGSSGLSVQHIGGCEGAQEFG